MRFIPLRRVEISPIGSRKRSLSQPLSSVPLSRLPANASAWDEIIGRFAEFTHQLDTHYSAGPQSCSCIDRVFTSIPPWLLLLLREETAVSGDPIRSHQDELSDHFLWWYDSVSSTLFLRKTSPSRSSRPSSPSFATLRRSSRWRPISALFPLPLAWSCIKP